MRRAEEGLMEANIDIEYYYRTRRKIKRITARIKEIDTELDSYGVSSPRILSKEEAKYQKGTRIHTDAPLLELISEKDDLDKELAMAESICRQIESKMDALQLTQEEKKMPTYPLSPELRAEARKLDQYSEDVRLLAKYQIGTSQELFLFHQQVVGQLEELCAEGHQDTGADQEHQTDLDPNKVIDHVVDTCQLFKKLFHRNTSLKNTKWGANTRTPQKDKGIP